MKIEELHALELSSTTESLGALAQRHIEYKVSPATARRGGTLWLHYYAEREWDVLHYRAQVVAWVTDAATGGNAVNVDRIEAHMSFNPPQYDQQSDVQQNTYIARTQMAIVLLGTPNPNVCGYGCAEHAGYGKWCNVKGCF